MVRPALVLAVAILLGGCSAAGLNKAGAIEPSPTTVTMANADGDIWPQPYVDRVASLSKGSLVVAPKLHVHHGDIDQEAELLDDVLAGRQEMALVSVLAFHGRGFRAFDALLAPFLVDSYALEQRVLTSPLASRVTDAVSDARIVALGLVPGTLHRLEGFTKPFVSVHDFAGARVGTSPGWIAERTLSALGAIPVPELFDGRAITATTDAIDVRFWTYTEYGERGQFLTTNVALWAEPEVIVMTRDRYDALTAAQRGELRDAAVQSVRDELGIVNDGTAGPLLCRRGMTFVQASTDDSATLAAAVRPVYDELSADAFTRELIGDLMSMKAALTASEPLPRCDAQPPPVATGTSPIDGTWQRCFTKAEFYAAGADLGERPVFDTMCLTLRFRRGTYEDSLGDGRFVPVDEVAARACDVAATCDGTFTVDGDVLTITDTAGDVFTYIWSLFNDTLTLKPASGAGGPTFLIVKPLWRVAAS